MSLGNSRIRIKVKNTGGILHQNKSISVRSSGSAIKSIEDIGDVDEIEVEEGSTVVYNAKNDRDWETNS